MLRSTWVLAALVLVVASGSSRAQSRTVPKQFDNVRSLGRALAEFKDDRIQVVVSYAQSQIDHDSRWLLIEFGALGRRKTTIERASVAMVTPDGHLVSHATPDRFHDARDVPRSRLPSSAARLGWYLPYEGLCCNLLGYFTQRRRPMSFAPVPIDPRYGPSFSDLLFESPTRAWDDGLYALVIPYDASEAVLPIELN